MARPTNTQFAVAVHLLTLLAGDPGRAQSSEQMAVSVGSNPVHMRRVLGRLRRAGIVESRPGPHGGWRLSGDPGLIGLGQVWRIVEGEDRVLGLHASNPECPVGRRVQQALASIDRSVAETLVAELDRTTVADVIAGGGAAADVDLRGPRNEARPWQAPPMLAQQPGGERRHREARDA